MANAWIKYAKRLGFSGELGRIFARLARQRYQMGGGLKPNYIEPMARYLLAERQGQQRRKEAIRSYKAAIDETLGQTMGRQLGILAGSGMLTGANVQGLTGAATRERAAAQIPLTQLIASSPQTAQSPFTDMLSQFVFSDLQRHYQQSSQRQAEYGQYAGIGGSLLGGLFGGLFDGGRDGGGNYGYSQGSGAMPLPYYYQR